MTSLRLFDQLAEEFDLKPSYYYLIDLIPLEKIRKVNKKFFTNLSSSILRVWIKRLVCIPPQNTRHNFKKNYSIHLSSRSIKSSLKARISL